MKWPRTRMLRYVLILLLLVCVLLTIDALCYQVTLPLEIDVQSGVATLYAGGTTTSLGTLAAPTALQFAWQDPTIHEYQIDGTDSTNNFTLDPAYLNHIASTPYYRFQAWMRDLDGASLWRDLKIWSDGRLQTQNDRPANGLSITLPPARSLRVTVQLQRPETPRTLNLVTTNDVTIHITLDRNDRHIAVTRSAPGAGDNLPVANTFFPVDPTPFAAQVVDTLARTLLWAVLVLLVVMAGDALFALAGRFTPRLARIWTAFEQPAAAILSPRAPPARKPEGPATILNVVRGGWQRLTAALHPVALLMLGASLLYVIWIARVEYNGEPHIFDAVAYLFAAKMYAAGHLSAPLPPAPELFPGPFMVQFDGRWFAQYSPGTALTLAPGVWLGVPYLVEPLLGTFALLGTGLIAARLYNRNVATLAVILGTLSPFYSYLAASYLSHTVALFYLVWGLWALLRFAQGGAGWNLPLSALFFGMAGLTRDQVTLLFVAIVLVGVLLLTRQRTFSNWRRWMVSGLTFLAMILLFVGISLRFNAILTGSPWTTPRQLFFAGDHWGFGPSVGFYGQHTVAAGLVNLDELLTILAIDLFGWPFYLTLALLAIPFLTRRAIGADWLMLAGCAILTGAYIGYFYHGIYLGPRYLFEALPFLLILTARGILTLAATGLRVRQALSKWLSERAGLNTTRRRDDGLPRPRPTRDALNETGEATPARAVAPGARQHVPMLSGITIALVAALLACNLLYFTPRQLALYQNYTGLPAGYHIDLTAVYHPPVHHAIVVTDDPFIYQFVLFALNDPTLHGDVIYASASNTAQYAELRQAFPGRALYRLDVSPDGSVQYVPLGN